MSQASCGSCGWSFSRREWARAVALAIGTGGGLRAGDVGPTSHSQGSGNPQRAPGAPAGKVAQNLLPREISELELDQALDRIRAVTSRPLIVEKSEHFQTVGDASRSFARLTLGDCESIASQFLTHYRGKGFQISPPRRRLTLVILQDERSFHTLVPNLPRVVTGLYRKTENLLVLYDFRHGPRGGRPARYSNLSTLAHEATHLISYNYGLLSREGDAPRAIVEGLATYAEDLSVHQTQALGQLNHIRLDDLAHVQRRVAWIPLEQLLQSDQDNFATSIDRVLLAYAQSWLLVYTLMTTPQLTPRFVAYLKAIKNRKDEKHRLEDAARHLGKLRELDEQLKRESIRLQRIR